MRLKKSSSGTVGPRIGGGGRAQRWSSKREPCRRKSLSCVSSWAQIRYYFTSQISLCTTSGMTYLALDQHVEKVVVRLRAVSVGHEVVEHGLVAVLIEPEAGQAAPCCWRLLELLAVSARDVSRLWYRCRKMWWGERLTARNCVVFQISRVKIVESWTYISWWLWVATLSHCLVIACCPCIVLNSVGRPCGCSGSGLAGRRNPRLQACRD